MLKFQHNLNTVELFMSLFLGIFILVVLLFAITGYFKGFLGAISQTVSLVAAYTATFFLIKPTTHFLQTYTELDGMIVYFVAGGLIFMLVSFLVTVIFRSLDKIASKQQRLSIPSKLGGLLAGTIMGVFFGFAAVYVLSVLQEIRQPQAQIQTQTQKSTTPFEIYVRQWVGKTIASITTLGYPDAAALTESFAQSPVATSKSIHSIAQNPDLKKLMGNPRYQQLLEQGDEATLMNDPLFQRLTDDSDIQYFLKQSNLISNDENNDTVLAEALINGWRSLQVIRNDPRVQEIIKDPDFQKKLQSGNKLSLMNDPKFKELTEAFLQAVATTSKRSSPPD
jgi:uncharacterized membrane protein required for colicin V production